MSPLAFLQQPYPGADTWRRMLRRSALIGAFVGGFLLLFQPFGLDDWQTNSKALKILGFGAITFGVLLIDSALLPRLFPRLFAEDRWTVGKEIAFILTHILLIAVANRFYLSWLLDLPVFGGWGIALGMTFLIGIFPTVGVVLANYIVQLRRYTREATALSARLETHHSPELAPESTGSVSTAPITSLTLLADNGKDRLTLLPDDLLAVESSDNYCTVYFLKRGQFAKELLRSSLSRLEAQLDEQLPPAHRPFARCHRSFVVNLDHVDRLSGNAQGYKLHLSAGELVVPVARQYNSTLVRQLRGE